MNAKWSFMSTDYNNMSKFLNRILGIEVELQNKLFRYFTDTLTSVIYDQKRRGAWDMGILGEWLMYWLNTFTPFVHDLSVEAVNRYNFMLDSVSLWHF